MLQSNTFLLRLSKNGLTARKAPKHPPPLVRGGVEPKVRRRGSFKYSQIKSPLKTRVFSRDFLAFVKLALYRSSKQGAFCSVLPVNTKLRIIACFSSLIAKIPLRLTKPKRKLFGFRGRITKHIKLLALTKAKCSEVYSDDVRRRVTSLTKSASFFVRLPECQIRK